MTQFERDELRPPSPAPIWPMRDADRVGILRPWHANSASGRLLPEDPLDSCRRLDAIGTAIAARRYSARYPRNQNGSGLTRGRVRGLSRGDDRALDAAVALLGGLGIGFALGVSYSALDTPIGLVGRNAITSKIAMSAVRANADRRGQGLLTTSNSSDSRSTPSP